MITARVDASVLRGKLRAADRALSDPAGALLATADAATEQAARLAPVRTGELAGSLHGDVRGRTAAVKAGVRYGRYVERGTRYMPGQHFAARGAQAAQSQYRQVWRHAIIEAFR